MSEDIATIRDDIDIRLIAIDLDGTLLDSAGRLPEKRILNSKQTSLLPAMKKKVWHGS